MADTTRLKREMLRAAVRENVEVLSGSLPRSLRKRNQRFSRWKRVAVLVVVPATLFVSINAISTGRANRSDMVVFSPHEAPVVAQAPGSSVVFAAPRRVDPTLFQLGVTTIVIDPGHGGADPGALNHQGLTEKEITLDVALRLKGLLEGARFKVEMTRSRDETVSLKDRALFANERRGDLFVSIHVNAVPRPESRLVETYYLGPSDDRRVMELAGTENRGSGYTMSNFKKLLEGIYADVRQSESRTFAQAVQKELFEGLRKGNPALENHGVKSAPFVVLIATEMPGILAEVSCISNEAEARNLAHAEYRQTIARALFEGLNSYAAERTPGIPKGS